jgi:hypothetical protein
MYRLIPQVISAGLFAATTTHALNVLQQKEKSYSPAKELISAFDFLVRRPVSQRLAT